MLVKVTKTVKRFPLPVIEPSPFPAHGKSIKPYQESYDILSDYLTMRQFVAIPENIRHFLRFCESFEPTAYYVTDDKDGSFVTVVDSCNGDVFQENIPLQKFINDALRYASERVIEEEM